MKVNRFSLALMLSITALLLIGSTQFTLRRIQAGSAAQDELRGRLNEIALLYLKTKYDVLITGTAPADGLIVEYDDMTRQHRTAQVRLNAALAERETLINKGGTRYTSIEVDLFPGKLRVQEDKLVLQATEHTRRYYVTNRLPFNSGPMVTEERAEHYFIFTMVMKSDKASSTSYSLLASPNEYTLTEDWIGKEPYGNSVAPNWVEPV